VADDPEFVDVARGMRGMVAEARVERNDRSQNREESRHPKIGREKMGDTITDRPHLLCRATCDEELRGVSELWAMDQEVEASCDVLSVPAFEVTLIQMMALKNYRLAGSTYFDICSGLLPFNITPADATSSQTRAMFVADRIWGSAFDLGTNPESAVIGPIEVALLRNLSGYIPPGLTEARTQIRST
jgi:hypothetical protein